MVDIAEMSEPPAQQPIVTISMRSGGLGAAAVLLAVGLFFAWQALLLDFGSISLPGPGFFPFMLGASLAGFAMVIGAGLLRESANGETVELGHRDVIVGFTALVAVCLTFEKLGTYISLGLFSIALLVLVGRVHPLRAAISAVIGMVGIWYFFKFLLGLQLPDGLMDFTAAWESLRNLLGGR